MIADPSAGGGRVGERLPALRAGARPRTSSPTASRVAEDARRRPSALTSAAALDAGFRYVVAVGDDATVQDVVNGLFRDGALDRRATRCSAWSPPKRDNDLLRSFGLPGDLDGGVRHLRGDTTYPFDLMRITCIGPDGAAPHPVRAQPRPGRPRRRAWSSPAGGCRRGSATGAGGSSVSGVATLGARRRVVRIGYDTKTWEGESFHVVIGNGQFASGVRLSPRSYPGDGVLDALVFTGQKSDAYTMMPRIMRHGGHVPDDAIKELRAKIRFSVEADRPLAGRGRRRAVRHHAGDVPGRAATDPAEALAG